MASALAAVVAMAGCGATASDEDAAAPLDDELATLELALSSNCGISGPVQRVFTGKAVPFTASVTMQQQGCEGDSYMFSIQAYNSGLSPLENPTIRPAAMPNNKADCEATDVRFYVWSGSALQGANTVHGKWKGASNGCELTLGAPATLVPGSTYKFGISARRPSTVPIPVRLEHSYE